MEKFAKENLFYWEKSEVVALAFRNRTAVSALSVKQQEKERKVYTALRKSPLPKQAGKGEGGVS